MPNSVDLLIERYEKSTGEKPQGAQRGNMFEPHPDLVRVVRCAECVESFTPMTVIPGTNTARPTIRMCSLSKRVKRDDGYCDEGRRKDD